MQRLRLIWPFVTFLASGALLAGAHAFERFGGFAPCALCLDQREWHWGVLAASALGVVIVRFFAKYAWAAALLIALVYVGATGMAAYHVAVEQHLVTAQCDAAITGGLSFDVDTPLVVPRCDTPAWTMFGISMAGYNALISFFLMLASFVVAFSRGKPNE
jgi:disulfide bond formation protein DsbB